jgi:hypothetical protein
LVWRLTKNLVGDGGRCENQIMLERLAVELFLGGRGGQKVGNEPFFVLLIVLRLPAWRHFGWRRPRGRGVLVGHDFCYARLQWMAERMDRFLKMLLMFWGVVEDRKGHRIV